VIDTAIILAVGNIAHQSQLIYNRPRTMLPALGKPLVVRVMDRLHRIGISKYVVILGEKEGSVATYLTTRWLPNVSIEFILKPNAQPLGRTLASIAQKTGTPMLIADYNSFTHGNFPARLRKYHDLSPDDLILTGAANSLSKSSTQTFALISLPGTNEIGYTTTPRTAAEIIESISPISSDRHQNLVISRLAAWGEKAVDFLANLPPDTARCDNLVDIITAYVDQKHPTRIARASWVLQVQTDNDLLTLNRHLLDEKIDAHILSELPYTVRVIEPVRIDPGVSVGQGAVIGPHVYLESGSKVGREARVENTIVMGRGAVAAREQVRDAIISSRGRVTLASS
jgi:NDP-sugar pyrophosphorylase family protein